MRRVSGKSRGPVQQGLSKKRRQAYILQNSPHTSPADLSHGSQSPPVVVALDGQRERGEEGGQQGREAAGRQQQNNHQKPAGGHNQQPAAALVMLSMSFKGVRGLPHSPDGSFPGEEKGMWFIQVQHGAQRIRRDLPERLSEKVRVYNQGVDGLTRSLHVYFVSA